MTIAAPPFSTLRADLRGRLLLPDADDYDQVRAVYNAMIDRRPSAIARCADANDVVVTIQFARDHDLPVSIRGGGHNANGLGVWDNALMIDLSPMRTVTVDPISRTVRVDGGCVWADVDRATHEFGLATPSGIISSTGVGGLTLGGGIGHLARRCGLTVDNLQSADVVLADGTTVTASSDSHPELFWALRGGGGNFGVVTSFVFRCHEVRTVTAGPIFYDLADTGKVLRWYREVLPGLPPELNGFFALLSIAPTPPFPEELWLRKVCGIIWAYTGPEERAEEVLAPVRAFGSPLIDGVAAMSYPDLQSMFDPLLPPGLQWYWRGDFINEITDAAIAVHERLGETLPTPLSTMHLYPIDATVHRTATEATAFGYRDAGWAAVIVAIDPDPANAAMLKSWAVNYWDALHPTSAGGGYVNFLMDESDDRVRASFGPNYARLTRVKAQYDPDNFFRINQNIPPAASA